MSGAPPRDKPTAAPRRHLLGVEGMDRDAVSGLLDLASRLRENPERRADALRGRTLVSLFYEKSTRTRLSFDLAARRLGMDAATLDVATSSTGKGESLRETVRTIGAMGVDCIVLRHASAGAPEIAAAAFDGTVVNAGDGARRHPTQALLDCLTIRDHLGGLEGKRVAIIGDCLHSRVARSNICAMKTLGATVSLVGPRSLVPDSFATFGVEIHRGIEEGLAGADVVYLLRIQLERQNERLFPSLGEYRERYGMDTRRLALAKPDAVVMHPGPANPGVEIDHALMEHERCLMSDQVRNGVFVRMAVLLSLLGEVDA